MGLRSQEQSKYERMWSVRDYRRFSPAEKLGGRVIGHLRSVGAQSVLDAGCGTGRLSSRLLDEGFSVRALDIADNCLDETPREKLGDAFQVGCLWEDHGFDVDAVVCVDVLEHIPTECVPEVLANLDRWGAHGFANVALYRDGFGKRIGETLHLTVKPAEWWVPKLPEEAVWQKEGNDLVFWW